MGESGGRDKLGTGEPDEGGNGGRHDDGRPVSHEEEETLLMKQSYITKLHQYCILEYIAAAVFQVLKTSSDVSVYY